MMKRIALALLAVLSVLTGAQAQVYRPGFAPGFRPGFQFGVAGALYADLTQATQMPSFLVPNNVATSIYGTYTNSAGYIRPIARTNYGSVAPFAVQGLVYEPAATNILPNSQTFTNQTTSASTPGLWNKSNPVGLSVVTGVAIGPDNTANAATLQFSGTATQALYQYFSGSVTANATYTVSFWARQSLGSSAAYVRFTTNNSSSVNTGISSKFSITSSWQRFSFAGAISTGTSCNAGFDNRDATGTVDTSITGNVDVADVQIELGSSTTTYVPTAASAVTRPADAATFTIPGGTTSLTYTFSDASTQIVTGLSAGAYTIPTNLNKPIIASIAGTGVSYSFLNGVPAGITYQAPLNGTVVNGNGLVGYPGAPRFDYKAVTNLILQSGTPGASPWATTGSSTPTVTQNAVAAPDGTVTASQVVFPAVPSAGNYSLLYQLIPTTTLPAGSSVTHSVYLRGAVGGEQTYISIDWYDGANLHWINQLVTLTTAWQRFTVSGAYGSTVSSQGIQIGGDLRSGSGQSATLAQTIYVAWDQLVPGSDPGTYIPTTTAAVTAYQPQGLLIEEGRTIKSLQSQFASVWAPISASATLTQNAATGPDGVVGSAISITVAATTGQTVGINQSNAFASGSTYSISSFVKAGTANYAWLDCYDGTKDFGVIYNITTGTVVGNRSDGTVGTPLSSGIIPFGNGWYRIWFTFTATGATASAFNQQIGVTSTGSTNLTTSNTVGQYIYAYGYQDELGAFLTSYTPTGATAVTRAPDVVQFANAGLTMLQGATPGLVAEVSLPQLIATPPRTVARVTNNTSGIAPTISNAAFIIDKYGLGTIISQAAAITAGVNRVGMAYSSTGTSATANGNAPSTSAAAIVTNGSSAGFGNDNANGTPQSFLNAWARKIALYPYQPPIQANTLPGAQLPYLLKRDVHPAANDNTPMFLDVAA